MRVYVRAVLSIVALVTMAHPAQGGLGFTYAFDKYESETFKGISTDGQLVNIEVRCVGPSIAEQPALDPTTQVIILSPDDEPFQVPDYYSTDEAFNAEMSKYLKKPIPLNGPKIECSPLEQWLGV